MSRSFFNHPADIKPDHAASYSAFLDAGLFHRDVSFGNIMIGLDDEGRLNDWDLCRGVNVGKSLEGPRTVRKLLHVTAPCSYPSTGDLAVYVYQVTHKSWVKAHNNRRS